MYKLLELCIVITGALAPLFFLANEVDGDEFAKGLSGIVLAGTGFGVVQIYKVWKGHKEDGSS